MANLSVHYQCIFTGDLIENATAATGKLEVLIQSPQGTLERPEVHWRVLGPDSRISLPSGVQTTYEQYRADGMKDVKARVGARTLTAARPHEVIAVIEAAAKLDTDVTIEQAREQQDRFAGPLCRIAWMSIGAHVLLSGGQAFTKLINQGSAIVDRANEQMHWRLTPPYAGPMQSNAFAPLAAFGPAFEELARPGTSLRLINAVLAYVAGCQATADPLALFAFVQCCELLAEEHHEGHPPEASADEQAVRARWDQAVAAGLLTKEERARLDHLGSLKKFRRLALASSEADARTDAKRFGELYSLRSKTAHTGHLWSEATRPQEQLGPRQDAELLARKYLALRLALDPAGLPRADSVLLRAGTANDSG